MTNMLEMNKYKKLYRLNLYICKEIEDKFVSKAKTTFWAYKKPNIMPTFNILFQEYQKYKYIIMISQVELNKNASMHKIKAFLMDTYGIKYNTKIKAFGNEFYKEWIYYIFNIDINQIDIILGLAVLRNGQLHKVKK